MQLTCQECGIEFTDRKGTKYCEPCRPIVRRKRAEEQRKTHPYKSRPNYCKCGKLIPKYKKCCDECYYNIFTCLVCNKQFKRAKKYGIANFCSQDCSHKFYSRKNVLGMHNKLINLESRYKQNDAILKAQQQLTGELLEKNNELKRRISFYETQNITAST